MNDGTGGTWVGDHNAGAMVDLYELTMAQAYLEEGLDEIGVFSLFARRLPPRRNFLLGCGLEEVMGYLESVSVAEPALEYLKGLGQFSSDFVDWLAELSFDGDLWAVAEGTPLFPEEPILELAAPLPAAQIFETFLMNQVHLQTMAASKAARVVLAAGSRPVVDFGLRRMHGADAGLKAARAFYIAGVAATSNVLAGQLYGIPVAGTMAHSYIQAHRDETEAFRAFARLYPDTTLLIDTYDTLAAVDKVIALAGELGEEFRVRAVRLDSGDLVELSKEVRRRFDRAGLTEIEIFASGGLDEHGIEDLLSAGAPLDAFGVGTAMGVSADAPSVDIAYKLTSYDGAGRIKLAPGKPILPGRKQIFRVVEDGVAVGDVLARHDEDLPGRPLLEPVMKGGRRVAERADLEELRQTAARRVAELPEPVRALETSPKPYPVEVSAALGAYQREVRSRFVPQG